MKIRTPDRECHICRPDGSTIVRAVGATTHQAIKRMLRFVEARIQEEALNTNTYVPPGHAIIGTCSVCGGPVTVPSIWHGTVPPTLTCSSCGAIAAASYGPVIPMRPNTNPVTVRTTDHV